MPTPTFGTQYDDKVYSSSTPGSSAYFRNGKKAGNLSNATDLDENISTGNGNDLVYAGGGNDTIGGGNGNDTIYGEAGNDVIWGDSLGNPDANDNGQDKLYGGDGNDEIHGGNGKDEIDGGADNDTLFGDNGSDIIKGGLGADTINGGNGGDVLYGGNSPDETEDTFVYTTNTNSAVSDSPYAAGEWADPGAQWTKPYDVIVDFESEFDKIDLSGLPLTGPGSTPLVWRGGQGTDADAGTVRGAFAHSVWTDANGKFLYADINGDGKADLKIQVSGVGLGNLLGVQENDAPVARDDAYVVDEDVELAADGDPAGVIGHLDDPESVDDSDDEGDDMDVAAVKVGTTEIVDGDLNDADGSVNGSIEFVTGAGGTVVIDLETGTFTYAQNGGFDYLADGEEGADSFLYKLTDGFLDGNFATVGITINGVNDAPVISVVTGDDDDTTDDDSVDLIETDGPLTATDTLTVTDVDTSDTVDMSKTRATWLVDSGYDIETNEGLNETALLAMFSIVPPTLDANTGDVNNATWSFDSGTEAFDFLQGGEKLTLTYTVQAKDDSGTANDTDTHDVTIVIAGTNDEAAFGGDKADSVYEDGDLDAGGTLTVNDADHDESGFDSTSSLAGIYGDFTFTLATGAWTYTLRNGDANVQALNTGDTPTDTLTVYSTDGSSDDIVVTINGADEPVTNQAPTALKFVPLNSGDGGLGGLGNFSATDPDLDVLTYSFSSPTTGFSVNSSTGALTIPDPVGGATLSTTLTVTATDPGLLFTSQTFNIWVGSNSGADTKTLSDSSDPNIADGRGQGDSITGSEGIDYIFGGSDGDTITGKGGADWLIGGNGVDTFRYTATSDSTSAARDTIVGFVTSTGTPTASRDKIDLSAIDAIAGGGNDAFTFNGTTATANGVWYAQSGSDVILYADTTGDTTPELEIHIIGIATLTANDFGASGALL